MISTQNYKNLPDKDTLKSLCKAISVLDAIISQEWEYRYYSYNSNWSDGEELLEMRNGEGDHMLILFHSEGCIINGLAHEYTPKDKMLLTINIPHMFEEFIFGEPVNSIGTTFCIWTTEPHNWQTGQIDKTEDGSGELLSIFDGNPKTYIDWAHEYYEDACNQKEISLNTVTQIYNGETLTKEMVLSVVDELEDWEKLKKDLIEINYPYHFK